MSAAEPVLYRLIAEIVYEAADDEAAGLLAAEIVALPLAVDAVWSADGDYYRENSDDPLNFSTFRMTAKAGAA